MSTNLVPVTPGELQSTEQLPALIRDSGKAAHFAYQEFFYGKLRNLHTRVAYERAVRVFEAIVIADRGQCSAVCGERDCG